MTSLVLNNGRGSDADIPIFTKNKIIEGPQKIEKVFLKN